jgi:hypothetical protein
MKNIEIIKKLLVRLKMIPNFDEIESFNNVDIIQFVTSKSSCIINTLYDYLRLLAAQAIGVELLREDQHGLPLFSEEYELIFDKDYE